VPDELLFWRLRVRGNGHGGFPSRLLGRILYSQMPFRAANDQ